MFWWQLTINSLILYHFCLVLFVPILSSRNLHDLARRVSIPHYAWWLDEANDSQKMCLESNIINFSKTMQMSWIKPGCKMVAKETAPRKLVSSKSSVYIVCRCCNDNIFKKKTPTGDWLVGFKCNIAEGMSLKACHPFYGQIKKNWAQQSMMQL